MSVTDEIYTELMEGLEKRLDWQQFLAKHSASIGPLYSAIGRFFTDIGPKIIALNEERLRQLEDTLPHRGWCQTRS